MTNSTTLAAAITSATSLEALRDAMNTMGAAINEASHDDSADYGTIVGDYGRAVEDAPTFGGTEPDDTMGVWSWDADHVLVGEGWEGAEIMTRSDWAS